MQSEVGRYSILHSFEDCFLGIFWSPFKWLNQKNEHRKQSSDIELLRTRLLFIGQVEPTKLQEGAYL